MEGYKKINDSQLKEVTGGSLGPDGYACDICGKVTDHDNLELFDIRIDYSNPECSEYLGKKEICHHCRDTHLADYIAKTSSGLNLAGVTMKGPLWS